MQGFFCALLGPHYLDRLIQFGYPIYVPEFDCLGFLSVLVTVDRWPELVNILYTSYNKNYLSLIIWQMNVNRREPGI